MKYLRSLPKILLWPLAGITLIAVGFFLAQYIKPPTNPIPKTIASELTFTPLIIPPDNKSIATTDYTLGPSDEGGKPLSFSLIINGKKVFVSESSLPQPFTEIPEYQQRFLDSFMLQSQTISSGVGTIYYGSPAKEQSYSQVAMSTEHGLLMLFSVKTDQLSSTEWRAIGDALTAAK